MNDTANISKERILLGHRKDDGAPIYLTKHSWSCGWYWSFGWMGNRNEHFHFEAYLDGQAKMPADLFRSTNISAAEWWVIRDLFIQAYALQEAAAAYRHGGHQTTLAGTTDLLKDQSKADALNADLERLLTVLWDYCTRAVQPKAEKGASA